MARRTNLPPAIRLHAINDRQVIHPHHLEDRIAIQNREIQTLLLDSRRLAAANVAIKEELSLAQQELRHLFAAAANVKAERDAEVREVYERSLKRDAEVRAIDAMSAELSQVGADIKKLTGDRQVLTAQLQAVNGELAEARTEAKQMHVIEAEIETVLQEIHKGRAGIEVEKKNNASNLEQGQVLEKNMITVAREIERLQAELVNAEKRARATAAAAIAANPSPGYSGNYGNPDTYSMPQVQGDAGHK